MNEKNFSGRQFIAPTILFIFFLALGFLIKYQPIIKIDLAVSRSLAVYRPAWLTSTMKIVTDFGYFETGILLVIIGVIATVIAGYYRLALLMFSSIAAAPIADIFKHIFARPRPTMELIGFNPIHANGWSYPSGHATFSAAVYGFMILLIFLKVKGKKRYFIAAIPAILLSAILFSRVYLGAHFITDVVGGLSLGLAWALLLKLFL